MEISSVLFQDVSELWRCMMTKKSKFNPCLVLIIAILIALQGCNLPGTADGELSVDERAQTSVALTLAVERGDEQPEGGGQVPVPTITDTLVPSITLTPTVTLTSSLETPIVSVSVDTNCRSGPGKIYDYIGALLVGERAEVIGLSMDGQYWIIKNPDQAGECWLWGNYATVVGPTASLPRYTQPPTPTPTFYWAGEWSTVIAPEDAPFAILYAMNVTVDEKDFTAVVDLGPEGIMNANGTISDDYLTISGTWTTDDDTGNFELFALGSDQFQGSRSNDELLAWCGGRDGADIPSPCSVP